MIQIDLDKLVPIEDLPAKLNQVVDDAHGGAIYVITKDDRPAVAIVSVDQLEGLSGRKVITPMSTGAESELPPPPSPAPLAGQAEPAAPPPPPPSSGASPTPPPSPLSDIATPTTSVQRDLTPSSSSGASPAPPPPPSSGASPTPPAADKPLDEMPL